ncbi:pirin family protein [Enemella sp. A6]|uniref:pirin family protein n=1 Tax=Enemella sp. A6 TaxID=3440152 RepID=UPI003EBEE55F
MSVIRETFALTSPWPTIDPFLFSMHHLDHYPRSRGTTQTPDADLSGRNIGQDFDNKDGWNMYHGSSVPGFPQHPHRGFETVTVVLEGVVDHTDSLGAAARYGDGDTQWLTAGAGVAHAEMFPLRYSDRDNPLELFQIWLNLAPEDKMAEPNFDMFWAKDTPIVTRTDAEGRESRFRLVAGELDGAVPPAPPARSWASRPENEVAIWQVTMAPGATTELPTASASTIRTVYVHRGSLQVDGTELSDRGAVLHADQVARLTAGADGAWFMMLQGKPIGAPVVQHGPFVGNTKADILNAFNDYQQGKFGAWTHPEHDPVNPQDSGRFARYPDGTISTP